MTKKKQVLCGLRSIFSLFNCQTPVCRYVAVIIPAAFLLSRLFGAEGVWNAFWVTELVSAAAAYVVYKRTLKQSGVN